MTVVEVCDLGRRVASVPAPWSLPATNWQLRCLDASTMTSWPRGFCLGGILHRSRRGW